LELGTQLDGNAHWLIRLRWVAVAGQLLTIATVQWVLHVPVAWLPLLTVVAITALTNIGLSSGIGGVQIRRPGHLAAVMVSDLVALTALLYFSGGPHNPFLVFYFVNLTLAAVVLPMRWSWGLAVMAVGCVAVIYGNHVSVEPLLEQSTRVFPFGGLYYQGLFVGFGVCALVIVYFVTRVRRELLLREQELREAQLLQTQTARLESLATLAAGAGHELASPLSTIAVIASDLSRHLDGADVPDSVLEDVSLIRSELSHCRAILDRMSGFAGEVAGEQVSLYSVSDVLHQVLEGVRRRERVDLQEVISPEVLVLVPLEGVAQAIRGVITNAIDASPPEKNVAVKLGFSDQWVTFCVTDEGVGMPQDVLARVGEPFFTTKDVGSGMGLGIFLTRNVLNRLGGELDLDSQEGVGTAATIRIPR
jgi:two-component system sensor histidine kinase RegB